MTQKNIHPESYLMKVETADGFVFETFSTKNMNGKTLQSDFSEKLLVWKKTGFGTVSEKDARVRKQIERQGMSYADFKGLITSVSGK